MNVNLSIYILLLLAAWTSTHNGLCVSNSFLSLTGVWPIAFVIQMPESIRSSKVTSFATVMCYLTMSDRETIYVNERIIYLKVSFCSD